MPHNTFVVDNQTIVASILLIVSVSMAAWAMGTPTWVVNNFSGKTRFGLSKLCIIFEGEKPDDEQCEDFQPPPLWSLTLIFIAVGIILMILAVLMLVMSLWRRNSEKAARLSSFFGIMFFVLAAIAFPFGFDVPEIGGSPYRLPANTRVGYSYFLFCSSILVSTVAVMLCNSEVIRRGIFRNI